MEHLFSHFLQPFPPFFLIVITLLFELERINFESFFWSLKLSLDGIFKVYVGWKVTTVSFHQKCCDLSLTNL